MAANNIVTLQFETSQPLTDNQLEYFRQALWNVLCDGVKVPSDDLVNFSDVPDFMLAPTVSQQ